MNSREVVICEPVRTPVGRYGGALSHVPAAELAATVVRHLTSVVGVPPAEVGDVILGQCYPNGEAPAIGRVAALDGGLPVTVPGQQIDRRCGSGLQAVINATMQVRSGASDLILAGGVESMSQAEYYTNAMRWGARGENVELIDRLARGRVTPGGRNFPVPGGMIETAENLRREYSISREEQDLLAVESHRRAVLAQSEGIFDEEIVPVTVKRGSDEHNVVEDEHPRADCTVETLARLRPIRRASDPNATVTAGNSSGQNDGAALCVVTTRERADSLGLKAYAQLKSWAVIGVHPATMGIGPVPATAEALRQAGLRLQEIDLIELNEAFAAQVLSCTREWGFSGSDFDRLNVRGSGISLGHPVGATGGRILATLLREMDRRGVRFGLETMCIGGGQGMAAVFERV